jgi:hypothetical protein
MAAGYLVVYGPWVVRNQMVFHKLIPFATEGGETLLGSNNPYVLAEPKLHGMWVPPVKIPEYSERLKTIHDDLDRSRVQNQMAMDWMKQHPGELPKLVWYKELRFLTPVTVTRGFTRLAVLASYGVLLALLAVGVWKKSIRRSPALDVTVLWCLTMLAITAVFWGNLTRGRVPLEVSLLPWGAIAFDALLLKKQK